MKNEKGIIYDGYAIFYSYSYKEIAKGRIMKYGNKTEAEADVLIKASDFFNEEVYPPKSLAIWIHVSLAD